jgi:glycerophosphoryl diester phosphodiesterase
MLALMKSIGHCDFIEIDVQLSSDKIAFIMHDNTLSRTTNVKEVDIFKSRKPYRVSDFTFDELSTLDYGSWFNNHPEPILSLCRVVDFIKENSMFINIEIKDMKGSFSDKDVVSIVLKDIESSHVEDMVLISSFRHEYLKICKQIMPNIATAALFEYKTPSNIIDYLRELKVDACHLNNNYIDKHIVKKLKKAGYFINVYTVNDTIRAKELFSIGINGVFTDFI